MESIAAFRRTVWTYYKQHGRHTLPWRLTNDPYHILVSEVMLQQTQVPRVLPKYQAFIKKYPTYKALAKAPLAEVFTLWVGLGYNRRAKFLKSAAEAVTVLGYFPKDEAELRSLPSIGPYTASAVRAFAYNEPVVMIETNIRTVFIYHFFADAIEKVSDAEILKLVEEALPKGKSKEWYAALMDYGVYLKKTHGNNTHRSASYTKQKAFQGSDRQIRGFIIKTLTSARKPVGLKVLLKTDESYTPERMTKQLSKLVNEGLLQKVGGKYRIAT